MSPSQNSPPTASRPRTILIVDDNRVVLRILSIKVEAAGYRVVTATDCSTAITLIKEERPDLMVLDVVFPADVAHGGMVNWDGFAFMSWMKWTEGVPNIPVIIITAGDPAKLKAQATKAGAVAFFQKPVDHGQLVATIRKVLGETTAGSG